MTKELIFVTAQPDIPYFHWQCQVYVHNFISLGINPNQIHIILGIVDGNLEPSPGSMELKKLGVNVHHYLDEREQRHYIPNIKPFLIYKWLEQYPENGKCFFLHDADIIFRKLPDFENLLKDDIIYLSDTIGYIGYNYLIDCCRRYENQHPTSEKNQLLQEMVDVVGITIDVVGKNQENSGGGQYIIKHTDAVIWKKIYSECTPLYDKMLDYQSRFPINMGQIQYWTAEMWSLLWNMWYFKKETKISDELSFSWATDTVTIYEKHNILHMAGVTQDLRGSKFFKGDYINQNPLDKLKVDFNFFDYIDKNSSTIKYIDVMKSIIKK